MQGNLAEAPTSTPLSQAQPTVQVATSININILPTAREPKRQLQRETNRPFVDAVFLFSFLNKLILIRKLLQVTPNLCHVFGGLKISEHG